MFTCKVVREVASGNVYKTILPQAIKYLAISNNPMAISKTTNEKHAGSYRLSIRTFDRKEYFLTKETFNYKAVYMLYEFLEAKMGCRKLKERHLELIEKLDEEDKLYFKDTTQNPFMIHSEKLQLTLDRLENIMSK